MIKRVLRPWRFSGPSLGGRADDRDRRAEDALRDGRISAPFSVDPRQVLAKRTGYIENPDVNVEVASRIHVYSTLALTAACVPHRHPMIRLGISRESLAVSLMEKGQWTI